MTELEELADEYIETDVLIIGAGLAGTMAAIRAKEKGDVDVVVVEKANMARSGDAGKGLDHYPAVSHRKINGYSQEEYGRLRANQLNGLVSTDLSITTAKYAMPPIAVLEQIGVRIHEDDGTYHMGPGRLGWGDRPGSKPGSMEYNEKEKRYNVKQGDFLLFRGADLKPKLAAAVRKRGVRVYERTMLTKLLTKDGSVVGATAVNTRNGKFYVIKSKFVFLGTGAMGSRLYDTYPYVTYPNNLFFHYHCPANAGGGHVAAYKAGANLVNMEFIKFNPHSIGKNVGPQGINRSVMKNSKGEKMRLKYADMKSNWKRLGDGGGGSIFLPELSNPDIERDVLMYTWEDVKAAGPETLGSFSSANETPFTLKQLVERGGVKAAPFEVYPWIQSLVRSMSGVMFDQNGETSAKGLFVAGDMVGGLPLYGSTSAFAWGYKIGDYLRELAPQTEQKEFGKEQMEQIRKEKERVFGPMAQKDGFDPLMVENLARKIVTNYVGVHKIEPRMKRCLEYLQIIRERMLPFVGARTYHELMRALELQDIVDIAQIHTQSAIMRTESRNMASHHRIDYPDIDDENWHGKVIVVNAVDGKPNHTVKILEKGA